MRRLAALVLFSSLFLGLEGQETTTPEATKGANPEKGSVELDKEAQERAKWAFVPDERLPNVLIIGDSISMGYTLPLRKMLQGVANVYHPMNKGGDKPFNCGPTGRGLLAMDAWLGTTRWKVIVFNFGLHDLEWHDASGKYVSPGTGKQNAPPELYEKNLRELVVRLKKSGATLVWANTTPVPPNSFARAEGDEVIYNQVAARVMQENNILICDLCAAVTPRLASLRHAPNNVHFNNEGYQVLANAVAIQIRALVPAPSR